MDYQSEKWHRKLKHWHQFAFIFYAVLTRGSSIWEVVKNFTLMDDTLVHDGISSIPGKSSIMDDNTNRNADVFGH
jgi:hypothetical protein